MRKSHSLISASLAVPLAALFLAGCTTSPSSQPAPSSTSASSEPSASPSPTPSERIAVLTLDGTSIDGAPTVAFDDTEALVESMTDLLGSTPSEVPVEGPYGSTYTAYDWPTVRVLLNDRITLSISANPPGVEFATEEGIGIGATRAEALAAGAEDDWDEDGDGVADYLMIGMREVAGTQSLERPGEVGVEYITLKITDDTVSAISTGGNDFSDI